MGPNLRGSLPSQFLTSHPIHATHPQKGKKREMGVDYGEGEEEGWSRRSPKGKGNTGGGEAKDHTRRAERWTTGASELAGVSTRRKR